MPATPPRSKRYIDAEEHLLASFRLARLIYESGFRPTFIVGLWRGGSTVGIAVQECLEYLGVSTDHIAIRTSYAGLASYREHDTAEQPIRIHGTQYLLEHLSAEDRLLLVDDVYSTGRSVAAVVARLEQRLRKNLPGDIRTAAVWYRDAAPDRRPPDFFLEQTRDWLVLPYELTGVDEIELRLKKPKLAPLLDRIRSATKTR